MSLVRQHADQSWLDVYPLPRAGTRSAAPPDHSRDHRVDAAALRSRTWRVSVLPAWLLREKGADLRLRGIRLGRDGLHKRIHLGLRRGEETINYMVGFTERARNTEA